MKRLIVPFTLFLASCVSVGSTTGTAGDTVTVSVTLLALPTQPVGGVQFTLAVAPPLVADGCQPTDLVGPLSGAAVRLDGTTKAVWTAPGATTFPLHADLGTCSVSIAPSAAPGDYPLALTDVMGSTAEGGRIALGASNGVVHVQ
jgi:hypothetical protein